MRTVLAILLLVTIVQALTRPAPPQISNVTFISNQITITLNSVPSAGTIDSCHAVLLTDLTTGFEAAYAVGNATSANGTVVTFAATPSNALTFPIDKSFRERYFIAVASSKKDATTGVTVFSPWRVFANSDGVPVAVSTNSDNTPENVFYRARKIDESGVRAVPQHL